MPITGAPIAPGSHPASARDVARGRYRSRAERTGTDHFAMMLYARGPRLPHGLGVVHVTLHMALRDVFQQADNDAAEHRAAD